jgi:hypothetical protein
MFKAEAKFKGTTYEPFFTVNNANTEGEVELSGSGNNEQENSGTTNMPDLTEFTSYEKDTDRPVSGDSPADSYGDL